MRRIATASCVALLLWGAAVSADLLAEVYIDGVRQDFQPQARVREGVAYAPLRATAEALGAEVTWHERQQQATVCLRDQCVNLSRAEGIVVQGRLLIPLRKLAEALEAHVAWYGDRHQVVITTGSIGMRAAPLVMEGVDGPYSRTSFADRQAVAVIFWANHCPTAVAYEERLKQLVVDYEPRGVQFVAVGPNCGDRYPQDNLENMKIRAAQQGYNFPYVRDETQAVARAYGALTTPDVFLVNPEGFVVYRGRIDDSQDPARVTRHDLREALDELLAGQPVSVPETTPFGCTVKWKD